VRRGHRNHQHTRALMRPRRANDGQKHGHDAAAAMGHTVRMPRVYQPDHTAHIRHRLSQQATYFGAGLVMAALMAAVTVVLSALSGNQFRTLTTVVWLVDLVLAIVSGLGLALSGLHYLWYRRHRAELDAAGAEVIGEFNARLSRRNSDEQG
jgi:hypothetical protein